MRNTLIIMFMIISITVACTPGFFIEREIYLTGYDFTEYTEKGFLFTPETYLGQYESIGIISVVFQPQVERIPRDQSRTEERPGFDVVYIGAHRHYVEKPNTDEIIDNIYEQSSGMGANALVNFQIDMQPMEEYPMVIRTVVSGFAIKRTDI